MKIYPYLLFSEA